MMNTPDVLISRLLDEEFERLRSADSRVMRSVVPHSIDRLATETLSLSRSMSREQWIHLVQTYVDPHPIVRLLSQDPYTRRAREKPRGYAGDAVMMDYCYFTTPPESTSELGKEIFYVTTTSPDPRGSLGRAGLLAARIDEIAGKTPRPAILALACGHLREALLSPAFRDGRVGRFIALDQDEISLAVVKARYASYGVECVGAKIKSILKGEVSFSNLDFVYAAGLARRTSRFHQDHAPCKKRLIRPACASRLRSGQTDVCVCTADNFAETRHAYLRQSRSRRAAKAPDAGMPERFSETLLSCLEHSECTGFSWPLQRDQKCAIVGF